MDRTSEALTPEEVRGIWPILTSEERVAAFRLLPRDQAEEFFASISARGCAGLLEEMTRRERRAWMRQLAPDDAADVIQELGPELRPELLEALDEPARREVRALLAYAEDVAGGLMNPRFARLRPDLTADEAIRYLRRQASEGLEAMYYAYVLDAGQRLLGVVSFRELLLARGPVLVRDLMRTELVTVGDDLDQEEVARIVAEHDLLALPVVDGEGRMKGIVTVDDVVDVVREEATEDIQKAAAVEALDAPYLRTGLFTLMRKRAGWLALLFLGEMLTATAMGRYEHQIATAVVLTVFLPLIISSGGNSGSQASMLVVRAMALGEVRLGDWWRVIRRELLVGVVLGTVLAALGLLRVVLWEALFHEYGDHYARLGLTVGASLVGVVCWGTLAGSALPLLLRAVRVDPATASAPLVATLVDVSGLVIYFGLAQAILSGTML